MRETIASWARVRGIQDALVEFHLEPGHPEVAEVCAAAPFPHEIFVATTQQGVQRNPWKAAGHAFMSSEFVILAEEDIVVATDTLEYFQWAEPRYRQDKGVLAISAANYETTDPDPAAVRVEQRFSSWVWGIWRDRWEFIGSDWRFAYEYDGWDYRLNFYWCRQNGLKTVIPHVSRAQHIGRNDGMHCTPEMFESLLSKCFLSEVGPQQYYVTGELHGQAVSTRSTRA